MTLRKFTQWRFEKLYYDVKKTLWIIWLLFVYILSGNKAELENSSCIGIQWVKGNIFKTTDLIYSWFENISNLMTNCKAVKMINYVFRDTFIWTLNECHLKNSAFCIFKSWIILKFSYSLGKNIPVLGSHYFLAWALFLVLKLENICRFCQKSTFWNFKPWPFS